MNANAPPHTPGTQTDINWMGHFLQPNEICLEPDHRNNSMEFEHLKELSMSYLKINRKEEFSIIDFSIDRAEVGFRDYMYDYYAGYRRMLFLSRPLMLSYNVSISIQSKIIQSTKNNNNDDNVIFVFLVEKHEFGFVRVSGRSQEWNLISHIWTNETIDFESKSSTSFENSNIIIQQQQQQSIGGAEDPISIGIAKSKEQLEQIEKTKQQIEQRNHKQKETQQQQQNSTSTKLKLMSYNIWNLNGEWKQRHDEIASLIFKEKPDIVGLQEVRLKCGIEQDCISQVQHLIDNYFAGVQFIYQPAMTYLDLAPGLPFEQEGIMILSRWPILEWSVLKLTRHFGDSGDVHQRACLRALIQTPCGRKVNVFVMHLTLSDAARTRSMNELRQWMSQFEKPHFIMTDFNAQSDSEAMKVLLGDKTLSMRDSWADSTVTTDWTFTTLEAEPKKRIDFVLYSELGSDLRITEKSLSPGESKASDHRALNVEFELTCNGNNNNQSDENND